MAAEERLNKSLYKIELCMIKVIPMLLAGITLLNTVLCYYGIDTPFLSYIGGVSFLTLGFLYLTSFVFGFCAYHRMFLHYTLVVNIINTYDYFVGIPIDTYTLFVIHGILTGIFIFFIIYLRFKVCKRD